MKSMVDGVASGAFVPCAEYRLFPQTSLNKPVVIIYSVNYLLSRLQRLLVSMDCFTLWNGRSRTVWPPMAQYITT